MKELDGLVDEYELKKIVKGKEMDFICIFYSYGYPDHFLFVQQILTRIIQQSTERIMKCIFRKLRMKENWKSFWIVL